MISFLPLSKLIATIAILYAAIIAIIIWSIGSSSFSVGDVVSIAFSGSAVISSVIMVFFYFGWKKIWLYFPSLNKILFPDLNGQWDMIIHWNWDGRSGTTNAKAYIQQNFLTMSMEMVSNESDSETLLAKPKKDPESGRPILYYVYRNIPKHINGVQKPPYEGAAILKLDHTDLNCLKGNYFTNSSSSGHYELVRTSE
jgi:hypothetical protein